MTFRSDKLECKCSGHVALGVIALVCAPVVAQSPLDAPQEPKTVVPSEAAELSACDKYRGQNDSQRRAMDTIAKVMHPRSNLVRPASVYIKPAKCEYSDCGQQGRHGNVVVVYSDLHEETITKDGNNLDPKLGSPDQLQVGWTTGAHAQGKYGHELLNNELVVYENGSFAQRIKAELLFIECWTWGDQYQHVAIRSRQHHGPSAVEKFDLRSGKREDSILGYQIRSDAPDWARAFYEGGWTLCQ